MPKPILISGIQPSGRLHIGNYLGALKHFTELQDGGKYDCFFFVADYHSITEPFKPKKKQQEITNLLRTYRAAGIDAAKSTVFIQSHIPEHTELAWILAAITPYGELARMTQFKDKSKSAPRNINAGLLTYPILMAADILLYDAAAVPVGEDQLQHLELTRELARRFNKEFGKVFTEPKPLMTETPRLMSLNNLEKKMSKSLPKGCLFLDDSPKEIRTKISGAVTDSGDEVRYDEENKKGISNLMGIYRGFSGKSLKEIEEEFRGKGYKEFKAALSELLIEKLAPFRETSYSDKELQNITAGGDKKASTIAGRKLTEIKKKLGLLSQPLDT